MLTNFHLSSPVFEISACEFPTDEAKRFLDFLKKNGNNIPQVKQIIFNDPATIVYWQDGTKTVVKTMHGDTFNEEYGVAMAYMKKMFGSSTGFKKLVAKYKSEKKPVSKVEKEVRKETNNKDNSAMNIKKRKIGDKVVIKKDLVEGTMLNGAYVNDEMIDFKGKEAIIVDYCNGDTYDYLLDIDDKEWSWSELMLESESE